MLEHRIQKREKSPSSRRAWIEISRPTTSDAGNWSPSSRRAWIEISSPTTTSEQRQPSPSSRRAWIEIDSMPCRNLMKPVALLAEGVDRNLFINSQSQTDGWSPSSRRAWIEIKSGKLFYCTDMSPSSRRAWIEISSALCRSATVLVALLAEGVDRNTYQKFVRFSKQVALLAEGVDRNFDG